MKQLGFGNLTMSAALLLLAGAASATPLVDSVTVELRTFNDCALSTVTTSVAYPDSVTITDAMDPACQGFANLHSFSFSEDGGATAAVFDNDDSFRFGADFRIDGAGEGEGGLRLSPWWGQYADGRFMANATTGEIAAFGGRLPFYSFTVNHGISYVKGTTIRMELTYLPHSLTAADPATIQYRVIYNGTTYDSPVIPFDEGNPAEDPPHGLWGILNDARAGGYFQVRANTGQALTATWSDIEYAPLGTPCPDAATIETRTFNDCALSTVTTANAYPDSIGITDVMDPACQGFANLHSWSFSEDGGLTAAVFNNTSTFHMEADFVISGPGEGEGGLRISPWYGQFVDGRFMANATTGEIAVFGGRLPFYSFTVNHGISYVKGTLIHMEMTYDPHSLTAADPATIRYRVIYNGVTYDSPVIPFDEGNVNEDPPYGLWGILNDSRAGGYFQVRANTGAALSASWTDILFASDECGCVDLEPPTLIVELDKDMFWPPNHKMNEVCVAHLEVTDDCDPEPVVTLCSITSDEPEDGPGDGHTANDIQGADYGTLDQCFQLRAERQGGGDGRVYTIIYCATDASGKTGYDTTWVTVPHDMRLDGDDTRIDPPDPDTDVLPGLNEPEAFKVGAGGRIEWSLVVGGHASIQVFNILGQKVRTVIDSQLEPGSYSFAWDGRNDEGGRAGSGIYFVKAIGPNVEVVRKITLTR